jgi:hypothetical protein
MPVQIDAPYIKFDDGLFVIELQPPTSIGGWNVEFLCQRRFGGVSGFFKKSMASGRYGVSGMNITNSGLGIMSITIDSVDTSGMEYGNYAIAATRLDSGYRTVLTEGYLILEP